MSYDPIRREYHLYGGRIVSEKEVENANGPSDAAVEARAPQEPPASLKAALKKAKTFIEYARYELQPGKATIGDQFPKQVDADEVVAIIDAALLEAQEARPAPPLDWRPMIVRIDAWLAGYHSAVNSRGWGNQPAIPIELMESIRAMLPDPPAAVPQALPSPPTAHAAPTE